MEWITVGELRPLINGSQRTEIKISYPVGDEAIVFDLSRNEIKRVMRGVDNSLPFGPVTRRKDRGKEIVTIHVWPEE